MHSEQRILRLISMGKWMVDNQTKISVGELNKCLLIDQFNIPIGHKSGLCGFYHFFG